MNDVPVASSQQLSIKHLHLSVDSKKHLYSRYSIDLWILQEITPDYYERCS